MIDREMCDALQNIEWNVPSGRFFASGPVAAVVGIGLA